MACNNCFNGCVETTSDKCIKYTGLSYPTLGIETGDSLFSIENAIITYLQTALSGTGIVMEIAPGDLCALVESFLPVSGDITLVDYISALLQTACSLQEQITVEKERINTIESNYTIGCLSGVNASDGTHIILQAVITKLCSVEASIAAVALDLATNYVKIADIGTYIADYIITSPAGTDMRFRLVPYTAVEYYPPGGSLANFDGSGAGIGTWAQIYLCNGQNNTPDKRGRSPIGVVTGMGGGAYSPVVDPINPANPNYTFLGQGGSNTVTLTTPQIPAHDHPGSTATTIISPNPHSHSYTERTIWTNSVNNGGNGQQPQNTYTSKTTDSVNLTATTVLTIVPQGNNEAHPNVHPVLACFYIMYIPNP